MPEFVHLHLHSEYSLLDGLCRIEPLVQAAAALGQRALAITDHATLYGVIPFTRACHEAGIRPVLGCEVYVAPGARGQRDVIPPYHLTLLAASDQGYQNLVYLSSLAHLEGQQGLPRVDWNLLERYSAGLICLSGCPKGEVPSLLAAGRTAEAGAAARRHLDLFGAGNYYVELMDHGLPEDARRVQALLGLARECGVPPVVTNDVHYLQPSDAIAHDVLLAIGANRHVDDQDRLRFPTHEYFLKSAEQMARRFGHVPAALSATLAIAERCQVGFTFGQPRLPAFQLPADARTWLIAAAGLGWSGLKVSDAVTAPTYLRAQAALGLMQRYGEPTTAQQERLAHELDVIIRMGFADYFLIVADFVAYARDQSIPVGPGRGSGAGSLVAYCLAITDVDPLAHDLIFERFLNPERVDMPDFDIDFCYERRPEVIDYVVRKYGEDHVAQIITFNTLAARAALRDVGRVLGTPAPLVDQVAKMVPSSFQTLAKSREQSSGLDRLLQADPRAERLFTTAQTLEGLPRNPSIHAAGVVVTATPLLENVPLYRAEGGPVTTQFEMGTLADLGLLKMDFLGLRTLTVTDYAVQAIRRFRPDFTMNAATHDTATFAMLARGETLGIFQLEADWVAQTLREMQPTEWEDITACISLCRPGPMENIPAYVAAKRGTAQLPHPDLARALGKTYGIMVYQEQVLQVAVIMGGFGLGEADLLRRAVSKKKPKEMAAYEEKFLAGCAVKGYSPALAAEMWALIARFAGYGFNKSHAAAYAKVALECAYLKCNWPVPYMAALMTSVIGGTSLLPRYLVECRRLGVPVLPPDVNESYPGFVAVGELTPAAGDLPGGGAIRFGLAAVKGVGELAVEGLVAARQKLGRFTSLGDLMAKVDARHLTKKALESLIKAGALDSLGERAALLHGLEAEGAGRRGVGQISLFDAPALDGGTSVPPASAAERLSMEAEALGFYLSGHPLEAYEPELAGRTVALAALAEQKEGAWAAVAGLLTGVKQVKTKTGNRMAFLALNDPTGSQEVVIFPRLLSEVRHLLAAQSLLLVRGRVAHEEGEVRLLAESVVPLAQGLATLPAAAKELMLYLRVAAPDEGAPPCQEVLEVLQGHPGPVGVRLKLEPSGRWIALHATYAVRPGEELLKKLSALLGETAVVLK